MFSLLVHALAFCGGFAIMSIELLGGRILAPWFGSSVHVWGSIISVFMLALSAGYLLGGRWSTRAPGLQRFGTLFIGGGLTLLPLIVIGDPVMDAVFVRIEDSRYGSLVASLVLFTVPTVILGMISPYSVRLLARSTATTGQTAGALYFISTLGSALGTLLTSFYFVLWFDIDTIIAALALVLLGCGAVAIALGRGHFRQDEIEP